MKRAPTGEPALRVRAATPDDAAALAPKLRDLDRRALVDATDTEPDAALALGLAAADESHAVVNRHGDVVALFGLSADPNRTDAGRPWLLASDELAEHSVFFLRRCRRVIDEMHRRHRILWNNVDARNDKHVEWLEFCGFRRVKTIEEHGRDRRPFHQYVRVREPLVEEGSP